MSRKLKIGGHANAKIVAQFKGEVNEGKIVAWAGNKMAAYKYPRIVECVQELPKKGPGKIVKRVFAR